VALLTAAAAAAGCPATGGAGRGIGRGTTPGGDPAALDGPAAVVVFRAYLRAGPGRGASVGQLNPDTVVALGAERGDWQEVEVRDPLPARGWVRRERLGCRALRRVSLEGTGEDAREVVLQPGALLAVLATEGEQLEVETRDPLGRRGRLPAADCGVGERFVPRLPRDGELYLLRREAPLLAAGAGGGPLATLPEGYRFVVQGRGAAGYAEGRTDGPVIVSGRIDGAALEEDPRSTPLDRLAEPLGYTHENVVEQDLLEDPRGQPVARLPGGTPMNLVERRGDWSRVRTVGPVELEGWVEHLEIRRVSLDHNELDPAARRRVHLPVDRDRPRAFELDDRQP